MIVNLVDNMCKGLQHDSANYTSSIKKCQLVRSIEVAYIVLILDNIKCSYKHN